MFRGRPTSNRRTPSFVVLLLINELFRTATDSGLPPVTGALIVGQILLYLRYIQVPWRDPWDVCISVDKVYWSSDWRRFLLSAFEHADDMHLYYNMVSFLSKGKSLERRFGSAYFLYLVAVFTCLTNVVYLALNYLLTDVLDDGSYSRSCAVGFSGVIFALKVLTTHYSPSRGASFMGIPIGSKYVVWSELVLIQLLNPGVSFIGHLSGILVGLAYVSGPLKFFMDSLIGTLTLSWPSSDSAGQRYSSRPAGERYSSRQSSSYSRFVPDGLSEEEQIRLAREASLRENLPNHDYQRQTPTAPAGDRWTSDDTADLAELRRRRLQHLNSSRR